MPEKLRWIIHGIDVKVSRNRPWWKAKSAFCNGKASNLFSYRNILGFDQDRNKESPHVIELENFDAAE